MLAARILVRPSAAWTVIKAARPGWTRTTLRHVLPLSLLPGVVWTLAQDEPLYAAFPVAVLSCLASVLLLASGLYLLAREFRAERSWDRCVAVAAYASTPALLGSLLFLSPMLAVIGVAALLHAFALCYLGVEQVLGCRPSEAALYAASASVAGGVGAMLLGALCSAAGLI